MIHNLSENWNTFETWTKHWIQQPAGNTVWYEVEGNIVIQPLAITFSLTTDATAVNRFPYIHVSIQSRDFTIAACTTAQPANQTRDYTFLLTPESFNLALEDKYFIPLPTRFKLRPGDFIYFDVLNMQAGDQQSAVDLLANKWIFTG